MVLEMEHDKSKLDCFVEDFVKILEKYGDYIIVSGYVAIALGRSRGTEDIDIIVQPIEKIKYSELHNELIQAGFECLQSHDPNEVHSYLKDYLSVRYGRKGTFIPNIELKFAKDELDYYQLTTKKKLKETGLDFYFSSVEMNIAFKEEYLKSGKDMEDAKHLRIVFAGKLNENEIEQIKKEIRRVKL